MSSIIEIRDFERLVDALNNSDWGQFWVSICANALLALLVALYAQRVIKRSEQRKNEIADVRRFNALVASMASFTESVVFRLEQLILPQIDNEKRHILAVTAADDIKSISKLPDLISVPKLPIFDSDKYNMGMTNLGSRVETMLRICRIENACNEFNYITEKRNLIGERISNGIVCEDKEDFFRVYKPLHHSTTLLMAHAETLLDSTLSMLAEIVDMNKEHREVLYKLAVKNVPVSSLIPNQTHFDLLARVRPLVDLIPDQKGRLILVKDFVAPKLETKSLWETHKGFWPAIRQFVRAL